MENLDTLRRARNRASASVQRLLTSSRPNEHHLTAASTKFYFLNAQVKQAEGKR